MLKIQQAREEKKWKRPARCTFEPHLGMEVRKLFQGSKTPFCGRVIVGEPVDKEEEDGQVYKNWCVEYTDGDREDMTEHELRQCYQWRARSHLSCTGRPFQCLELFCGRGVVSQEFIERKWKVQSVVVSSGSSAALKKSILRVKPEKLDFTPDFIWASPPYQTSDGELNRSGDAHGDFLFKIDEIICWAREKHHHVIVVIENLPIAQHFVDKLGLLKIVVDHCALGRDAEGQTMLWTNDHNLNAKLSTFKSGNVCSFVKVGQKHSALPLCTTQAKDYNNVPQPLAEEVADYVNAKFCMDNIRRTKAVAPNR